VKAFLLSLLLLVALTAVMVLGFRALDFSSSTVYTEKGNVRL